MIWTKENFEDKVLDEESYKSFLLGYQPDWEMRFAVYYEDGWSYVYRSFFLLKKFKFTKQSDGLYHLTELYKSEKEVDFDIIENILLHGYFQKPFNYINRLDF